jgi:hypothetical protein
MNSLTGALLALSVAPGVALSATVDLAGNVRDPFAHTAKARVFLFIRTDCPITNRYAPEIRRLADQFSEAEVWLVYPDPAETTARIQRHLADFGLAGQVLRDPRHELVKRAHVTIAPEAAVFDAEGRLVYHGRIDDLYVDVGRMRPQAKTHDLEEAIAAVLEARPVRVAETRAIGCSIADVR